MDIELNIGRLRHLLSLYGMSESDLMDAINAGRKRKYAPGQVFAPLVDVRIIRRIDGLLFNKGLSYYADPAPVPATESMSVFFRRKSFGEKLNFASKRIVNNYESLKNYLSSLDSLSNVRKEVALPRFSPRANPGEAAARVRDIIYPQGRCGSPRDFLKRLIDNLASAGVLVFEHIESPNRKDKANIDGFFLHPNFIVLKRHSLYKREIFTLLHEVGHCVLGREDVESTSTDAADYAAMSATERWCNDFAYHFLVGDNAGRIDGIVNADGTNDYRFPLLEEVSSACFISKRALFTRLLYLRKISPADYRNVMADLDERFAEYKARQKQSLTGSDGTRRHPAPPRPIYSPMFLSTIAVALNDGSARPSDLYRMKIPARVVEGLNLWL